jgi:allophanate hydrolase subunit 2
MLKIKVIGGKVALRNEAECDKSAKENLALGNVLVGNDDDARALLLIGGYAEIEPKTALHCTLINGVNATVAVDGLPLPHNSVFFVPAESVLTIDSKGQNAYLVVAGGLQRDANVDNADNILFVGKHQNRRCEVGDYIARGAFRRRTPKQHLHVLRTEGDNLGDWGSAIALEATEPETGTVVVGGGERFHVAEVDWPLLGLLRNHQRVNLKYVSAEEDRQLAAHRRQSLRRPGVVVNSAKSRTILTVDDEQHAVNFSPLLAKQTYGQSQVSLKDKQSTIHAEQLA